MKVFHGSTVQIQKPLADIGRDNLDFGKGCYVTNLYTQAERWALVMTLRRPDSIARINQYELDTEKIASSNYKLLHFAGYNIEWLDFIVANRRGEKPWKGYDLIEGGIANDRVFDTIENYIEGQISKETALGRLQYEQPNNQICLLNQQLIDECLSFQQCFTIKPQMI